MVLHVQAEGVSRYDVRKNFGFFDPLPPCLHLDLIYTIKFTQPLLLRPLFHDPPPMRTSYLEAPLFPFFTGVAEGGDIAAAAGQVQADKIP